MTSFKIKGTDTGIDKFGYNGDVDAAEDIWSGGGAFDWTKVAANAVTTIESSHADDDGSPVGAGMRTCEVEGLVIVTNAQGITGGRIYRETVTLNGVTAVTLANQYAFVYRVAGKTWGASNANVGLLSVKHGADVIARVEIGINQSEMALMIVPQFDSQGSVIHGAFLSYWGASVVANTAANAGMSLQSAPKGEYGFSIKRRGVLTVNRDVEQYFQGNLYFKPGTKLKVKADTVSAANQNISGQFTLEYDKG